MDCVRDGLEALRSARVAAILAFAQERTGHDVRVALGYSLVYPTALVVKILLAQLLTLL